MRRRERRRRDEEPRRQRIRRRRRDRDHRQHLRRHPRLGHGHPGDRLRTGLACWLGLGVGRLGVARRDAESLGVACLDGDRRCARERARRRLDRGQLVHCGLDDRCALGGRRARDAVPDVAYPEPAQTGCYPGDRREPVRLRGGARLGAVHPSGACPEPRRMGCYPDAVRPCGSHRQPPVRLAQPAARQPGQPLARPWQLA